jgi:hypothetical protein
MENTHKEMYNKHRPKHFAPCNRVLIQKLIVAQSVQSFPLFMKLKNLYIYIYKIIMKFKQFKEKHINLQL